MKQRLFIWLFLIILVFGGYQIYNIITTPKTEITIEYNAETNPELIGLRDISFPKTKPVFNLPNPEIILTTKEQELTGYKKYDDFLYSPLVLFMGNNALETDSGFSLTNISSDKSYRKAEKNLHNILIAIEENKTWQDIGIKENIITGKIKLAIPDKSNEIHKDIVKLFAINLVDELTAENLGEVLTRVDKIIEKCEHIEHLETYISNQSMNNTPQIALIAPEYYAINKNTKEYFYSDYTENNKNTFFIPIYFTRTIAINYNLFIKQEVSPTLQKNILDTYSSKKIMKYVGLRPINDIDYTNINRYIKTDVNISNIDSSITEQINLHKTPEPKEEKVEQTKTENQDEENNGLPPIIIALIIICGVLLIGFLIWLFVHMFEYYI